MFPETVFIVGGGPSAGSAQELDALLDGQFVIAINRAGAELRAPNVIFWTDFRVWRWYGETFKSKGAKLVHPSYNSPDDPAYESWDLVKYGPFDLQLVRETKTLSAAHCSGFSAIHYAAVMGAKKIILVGFDVGVEHWHAEHPLTTPESAVQQMNLGFRELANYLRSQGIEVWNTSVQSKLREFPACLLTEAVTGYPLDRRGGLPEELFVDVPAGGEWQGERFYALQPTVAKPKWSSTVLAWGCRRASHWKERGNLTVLVENGPFAFWKPGSVAFQRSVVNADTSKLPLPASNTAWIPPVRVRKLPGAGAPVLVVGQMGSPDASRSMPYDWPQKIVNEIRLRCPGRSVWFRPHPKSNLPEPKGYDQIVSANVPLEPLVTEAWAVVGWSSAALLVALSHGVPVFNMGPYGWAKPLSYNKLLYLRDPPRPAAGKVELLFKTLAEVNADDTQLADSWRRFWR